jgi:hypothetical protein
MSRREEIAYCEFDPVYDTGTSFKYGRSRIGLVTGILLIPSGIVLIALSIVDLERGLYNANRSLVRPFTWNPNPLAAFLLIFFI